MPLDSIDVEINHHFLESTIGALESKIEVLSLYPLPGCLSGNERAFEEATLLESRSTTSEYA